jgi:F0F1-type ATP synthase membrane subunit c/vacuolar-type H+-ATPase subunit K
MEIAATGITQQIQRAVAKKAVELILRNPFMTGKIFTFFVLEKFIMF